MVKTVTTELNEDGEWDIADDADDDVLDDLIAQMIGGQDAPEATAKSTTTPTAGAKE